MVGTSSSIVSLELVLRTRCRLEEDWEEARRMRRIREFRRMLERRNAMQHRIRVESIPMTIPIPRERGSKEGEFEVNGLWSRAFNTYMRQDITHSI